MGATQVQMARPRGRELVNVLVSVHINLLIPSNALVHLIQFESATGRGSYCSYESERKITSNDFFHLHLVFLTAQVASGTIYVEPSSRL